MKGYYNLYEYERLCRLSTRKHTVSLRVIYFVKYWHTSKVEPKLCRRVEDERVFGDLIDFMGCLIFLPLPIKTALHFLCMIR